MVPMKYPVGQEWAYRRIMFEMTLEQKKLLKKIMAPKVPEMVAEVTEIHLPTGQIVRQDAWHETLLNIVVDITKGMVKPTNAAIQRMAREIGPGVNRYNKAEWQRLIRSQYGVDPTKEDPDKFATLMRDWSLRNAALIKDIPDKTINQIAKLTEETLRSGKAPKEMRDDVYNIMSDRTDVSDSRVKLIARDQVSKLNGQLTGERQQSNGVSSYTWRTVGDERVRDTHDDQDGNEFQWDDPPGETGHPGEDYQCRCWAEPILPEYLEFEASLGQLEETG